MAPPSFDPKKPPTDPEGLRLWFAQWNRNFTDTVFPEALPEDARREYREYEYKAKKQIRERQYDAEDRMADWFSGPERVRDEEAIWDSKYEAERADDKFRAANPFAEAYKDADEPGMVPLTDPEPGKPFDPTRMEWRDRAQQKRRIMIRKDASRMTPEEAEDYSPWVYETPEPLYPMKPGEVAGPENEAVVPIPVEPRFDREGRRHLIPPEDVQERPEYWANRGWTEVPIQTLAAKFTDAQNGPPPELAMAAAKARLSPVAVGGIRNWAGEVIDTAFEKSDDGNITGGSFAEAQVYDHAGRTLTKRGWLEQALLTANPLWAHVGFGVGVYDQLRYQLRKYTGTNLLNPEPFEPTIPRGDAGIVTTARNVGEMAVALPFHVPKMLDDLRTYRDSRWEPIRRVLGVSPDAKGWGQGSGYEGTFWEALGEGLDPEKAVRQFLEFAVGVPALFKTTYDIASNRYMSPEERLDEGLRSGWGLVQGVTGPAATASIDPNVALSEGVVPLALSALVPAGMAKGRLANGLMHTVETARLLRAFEQGDRATAVKILQERMTRLGIKEDRKGRNQQRAEDLVGQWAPSLEARAGRIREMKQEAAPSPEMQVKQARNIARQENVAGVLGTKVSPAELSMPAEAQVNQIMTEMQRHPGKARRLIEAARAASAEAFARYLYHFNRPFVKYVGGAVEYTAVPFNAIPLARLFYRRFIEKNPAKWAQRFKVWFVKPSAWHDPQYQALIDAQAKGKNIAEFEHTLNLMEANATAEGKAAHQVLDRLEHDGVVRASDLEATAVLPDGTVVGFQGLKPKALLPERGGTGAAPGSPGATAFRASESSLPGANKPVSAPSEKLSAASKNLALETPTPVVVGELLPLAERAARQARATQEPLPLGAQPNPGRELAERVAQMTGRPVTEVWDRVNRSGLPATNDYVETREFLIDAIFEETKNPANGPIVKTRATPSRADVAAFVDGVAGRGDIPWSKIDRALVDTFGVRPDLVWGRLQLGNEPVAATSRAWFRGLQQSKQRAVTEVFRLVSDEPVTVMPESDIAARRVARAQMTRSAQAKLSPLPGKLSNQAITPSSQPLRGQLDTLAKRSEGLGADLLTLIKVYTARGYRPRDIVSLLRRKQGYNGLTVVDVEAVKNQHGIPPVPANPLKIGRGASPAFRRWSKWREEFRQQPETKALPPNVRAIFDFNIKGPPVGGRPGVEAPARPPSPSPLPDYEAPTRILSSLIKNSTPDPRIRWNKDAAWTDPATGISRIGAYEPLPEYIESLQSKKVAAVNRGPGNAEVLRKADRKIAEVTALAERANRAQARPKGHEVVKYDPAKEEFYIDPDFKASWKDAPEGFEKTLPDGTKVKIPSLMAKFQAMTDMLNKHMVPIAKIRRQLVTEAAKMRDELLEANPEWKAAYDLAQQKKVEAAELEAKAASWLARVELNRQQAREGHGVTATETNLWKKHAVGLIEQAKRARKEYQKAAKESGVASFFEDVESLMTVWTPRIYHPPTRLSVWREKMFGDKDMARRMEEARVRIQEMKDQHPDANMSPMGARTARILVNQFRRLGIPLQDQIAYGLVQDPVATSRIGFGQVRHALATFRIYTDLYKNGKGKYWTDQRQPGFEVQLPSEPMFFDPIAGRKSYTQKFGPLSGKWMKTDIGTEMLAADKFANDFSPFITAAMRHWKFFKTAGSPFATARNNNTNLAIWMPLFGCNPANPATWPSMGKAFKDMWKPAPERSEAWKIAHEAGLFDGSESVVELNSEHLWWKGLGEAIGTQIRKGTRALTAYDLFKAVTLAVLDYGKPKDATLINGRIADSMARRLKHLEKGAKDYGHSIWTAYFEAGSVVYGTVDNWARHSIFLEKLRKENLNPDNPAHRARIEEAARETRKHLPDYSDLSLAVQWLRSGIGRGGKDLAAWAFVGKPFIAYTAEAMPKLLTWMQEHPAKAAMLMAAYDMMINYQLAESGMDDDQLKAFRAAMGRGSWRNLPWDIEKDPKTGQYKVKMVDAAFLAFLPKTPDMPSLGEKPDAVALARFAALGGNPLTGIPFEFVTGETMDTGMPINSEDDVAPSEEGFFSTLKQRTKRAYQQALGPVGPDTLAKPLLTALSGFRTLWQLDLPQTAMEERYAQVFNGEADKFGNLRGVGDLLTEWGGVRTQTLDEAQAINRLDKMFTAVARDKMADVDRHYERHGKLVGTEALETINPELAAELKLEYVRVLAPEVLVYAQYRRDVASQRTKNATQPGREINILERFNPLLPRGQGDYAARLRDVISGKDVSPENVDAAYKGIRELMGVVNKALSRNTMQQNRENIVPKGGTNQ